MTKQRYIVIQEWMRALDLNASELLAYALIWGFCQDGESDFHGSVAYVADWCKLKERQAHDVLRKLTEKGYIEKVEYPGHTNHYKTTPAIIAPLQKLQDTPAIIAPPTPAKIADNNKVLDNKEDNKDIPVVLPRVREKLTFGEYVQLTEEEHAKLVRRFGAEDTARLIEILDGYLSNPKQRNRYADHYRAILGWPVTRLQEEKLTAQRLHNSKEAGQRVASGGNTAPVGYGEQAMANARRLEELLKG